MSNQTSGRGFNTSRDWWGPRWTGGARPDHERGGEPRSVLELIDDGTLDPWVAAFLWEVISRRSSIVVVAGPSGVGKTTLLTALTDFLPTNERLVVVRGVFDPLSFLDELEVEPFAATALVNEISPHLPIYLWGPGVGRLLTSRRRFRVFATAHASSTQDLVAQLAGYPLRVPLAGIARLDVVVRLEAWRDRGSVHRAVTEVTALDPSERDGIVLRPMLAANARSLDRAAARMWFDEVQGRGDEVSMIARHKTLAVAAATPGVLNRSDCGPRDLREVLAGAFARVVSGT